MNPPISVVFRTYLGEWMSHVGYWFDNAGQFDQSENQPKEPDKSYVSGHSTSL